MWRIADAYLKSLKELNKKFSHQRICNEESLKELLLLLILKIVIRFIWQV